MARSILNLQSIYFYLLFATTTLSLSTLDEHPWNSPAIFNNPCPGVSVPNGRVKIRSRGRTAKFVCRSGYQMLGRRYLTCVRGRWNFDPPLCITRGCPAPIPSLNSRLVAEMRGALVRFKCDPGYEIIGSSVLVCDGVKWNGTAPTCKSSSLNPSLSCDFEKDMCGWSQDPSDQFDWKRFSSATPSGHMGTGPPNDHTHGVGQTGYYLYIEASSPRKENDTARLFSPVFSPEQLGNDSCFLLWYHMYGLAMGTLKIYLKPQSKNFADMTPSLSISGNQGNQWILARLQIVDTKEPLQVVVEGIRGYEYTSDMAIDDVSMQFGIDCVDVETNSSTAPSMVPMDTSNSSDTEQSFDLIPASTQWTDEDSNTGAFSPLTDAVTTSYPLAPSAAPSQTSLGPNILQSKSSTAVDILSSTALTTTALPTMPSLPQTISIRMTPTTQKPMTTTAIASTTTRITLTTPKNVATTSKIAPTTTRISPTTTRVAPTATRVNPTTTRIAPTTTRIIPTTTAPTTTRIAPTTTRIVPTTTSNTPTTTRRSLTTTTTRSTPTTKFNAPIATRRVPTTIRSAPTTTSRAPTTTRSTPTTTQKSKFTVSAITTTRLTTLKTTSTTKTSTKTPTKTPIIFSLPPFKIPPSNTRVPFFIVTTKKPFFRTSTATPPTTSMPPLRTTSAPLFTGIVAKKPRPPFAKVVPKTTTVPTTTAWWRFETTDTFNEVVTDFPGVDFANRPMLPPWFHLKREEEEEDRSEPDNRLYPMKHQAHTGSAPVSVPVAIGIACVAVAAVVILVVAGRSIYRRRKAGQDGLTEDSDVRYLKDGEVRVEFFDRSFREDCSGL